MQENAYRHCITNHKRFQELLISLFKNFYIQLDDLEAAYEDYENQNDYVNPVLQASIAKHQFAKRSF